jgi:hypothetical protein
LKINRSATAWTAGLLLAAATACQSLPTYVPPHESTLRALPPGTATVVVRQTILAGNPVTSPTVRPTPEPEAWKGAPVVPAFDGNAVEIYRRGLSLQRNSRVFSKIGDCQNITTYFLADFENPDKYRLGEYADLQATIDWFKGSFGRKSAAVRGGMNVAAVMNPLMANPDICAAGETPLGCELRLNDPSVAIISMEEAWSGDVGKYEVYMRQVIEYTISQGVVPIIATKADNLEGGDRINRLIARLAWEYDIPLWNFWAAVQPLPARGLSEDGFHLTQALGFHNYFFDEPPAQWSGWMARNLTALQALDAARRTLIEPAAGGE